MILVSSKIHIFNYLTKFKILSRRWVVERTFTGLCKLIYLSQDYERLPEVNQSVVDVAVIPLVLNHLTA
ncbi:MAG: transposase [Symploca sp. SIO2B6]|nr:transposase [Symploca sp. SIO2B6]